MFHRTPLWRRVVLTDRQRILGLLGVLALLFVGVTLAQLTRALAGANAALNVGDIATRDIRTLQRASIVSDVETNRQRDLAVAAVQTIYTPPDGQVARRQLQLAREALAKISQLRVAERQDLTDAIRQVQGIPNVSLDEDSVVAMLNAPVTRWPMLESAVMAALDEAMRDAIRVDNLDSARTRVAGRISFVFSPEEGAAINAMTAALLVPNTSVNTTATNDARRRARDAVKPVERTYSPGQVIVRSGELVGAADVEALTKLNLQGTALNNWAVLSALTVGVLATLILMLSVMQTRGHWRKIRVRHAFVSALLFVIALLVARWFLPGRQSGAFVAPLTLVAMCITAWLGVLPGAIAGMLLGGLVGIAGDRATEIAAFYAVGGVMGALGLSRVERISDFVRAAGFAMGAQMLVLLAFELPEWSITRDTGTLLLTCGAALAAAAVSGALAPVFLYVSGWLTGIVTPLQLIELARPSHPLLQRMITQAPGSYHHSLMVANLAEQAAERIGADSLLVRVGAYYHDIGKLKHPYFFAENQLDGKNVHDQLDPLTSARVLHGHVTDGLAIADDHSLPPAVRAFIGEHHGTTRTGFAYARAVKANNDQPVDDAPFRYPGPLPGTRETALVMLADASEAIVRARRSGSLEQTEQIVQRLISDRIADGQLNQCDLSLRDLELVRQSFIETLRGMYHPRIEYPEIAPATQVPALLPEAKP